MTNTIIALAVSLVFQVESGGRMNPPAGDSGRAIGPFQMWTVSVDEANRIARLHNKQHTPWTYEDRKSYAKSRAMCYTTLQFHYNRGTTDPVTLASKWRNPYSTCPEWHVAKLRKAYETKTYKMP